MSSVLLATCADLAEGDEDAGVLMSALGRHGVESRVAVWTDPTVDWNESLVVIRSTWDYTVDRARFVDWAGGLRRVANAADVIAWNTDKTYLLDLARTGVPTVPTIVVHPGTPLEVPDHDRPGHDFVVKPSVGAGSRGVGRFAPDRLDDAQRHADTLHEAGLTVLVQPYLTEVDTSGETTLVYFDGRFSHAVRKAAMLAPMTAHPIAMADLFVEERIQARTPSAAELTAGATVLAAVRERFGADQLFTRVDLLPTDSGPLLVELELTEPSLFLGYADQASDRFAAAIAMRA